MAEPDPLSWWKKLVFALVPLLLLLVAVEAGLRLWSPAWTVFENRVPLIYEPHEGWGYRYAPGSSGEMVRYREIRQEVRIGPHGWRGKAPEVPKPEGLFRIVVVGDSHTAGLEVREEETLPAALARALEMGTGRRVEAVNLGLDGSGTDVQRRILLEEGLGFEPDLVLLQVFRNDFRDTGRDLVRREVVGDCVISWQTEEERAVLRARAEGRRRSPLRLLARISFIARAVRFAREGEVPSNFLTARTWYEERQEWEPLPERVAGVVAEIEAMATASREAGVEFAILAVPASWILQQNRDASVPSYPASLLGVRLEPAGVPMLDLRPAMLAAPGGPEALSFRTDSHPNARGYEVMAEATADWLEGTGLVPGPGGS